MTHRLPGRTAPPWCPSCNASPGPDCPAVGKSPRQVRRQLQRDLRREIAAEETR